LLGHIVRAPKLASALFPDGPTTSPYEVLHYNATLILHDAGGRRATFQRTEQIRMTQHGVSAILDHFWGDGVQVSGYHHDAGVIAESFKDGGRRHLVIDLRRRLARGEELTFTVSREAMAAFLESEEWVETIADHPMERLQRQVIFPRSRPCQVAEIRFEGQSLAVPVQQLPDGRTRLAVEILLPLVNVPYTLVWRW
jgi:hypothetical protein